MRCDGRVGVSSGLHFDLFDKVVFLGVFLELVLDGADDLLDFLVEQVLERVDVHVHVQPLLLVLQNGHHLRVMVAVLLCVLSVVQVNQHVRQVLVQSVFDGVLSLLVLSPLRLRVALGPMLLVVLLGGLLSSLVRGGAVVLLVSVVVLGITLRGVTPTLVILLAIVGWLLVTRSLARLVRLALVSTLGGPGLAVLSCIDGLVLLTPLVLVLDFVRQIVFMALFGSVDSFFFSVFVFAVFFALLIVSLCIDVLSGAGLGHGLAGSSSLLGRLSLSLLCLGGLSLLLVDQVVHRHYRLLASGVCPLVVRTFWVLGAHCLIRLVPSVWLLRAS